MSDTPSYKPGDVANGHYLGDDNVWHPVADGSNPAGAASAPPPPPIAGATPLNAEALPPGADAAPTPAPADPGAAKPRPHVLSIIALVAAVIGFIFACIPGALIVGWILLPIAIILAIVALFTHGTKWAALTALIVGVVGIIVGFVVFFAVVATSLNDAFGTTGGTVAPVPSESATSDSGEATADAGAATNPTFGDTFTYKDGVTVSVSAPTPFTSGQYAAGATQAANVTLTFTIVNGSKKNLDVLAVPTVTSAGTAASEVIDSDNPSLSVIAPTSTVLPGQSLTWTSGYSIADPNNLQVEISPGPFAYDKAIFTNVK